MENKVLVILSVPDLDETYDLMIPINRKVGNLIELINKFLEEQAKEMYKAKLSQNLYNKETGTRYSIDLLVADTDIRNGTKLVLI